MLVVDASVALNASMTETGFQDLGDPDLVAPRLMWSEARSTLHLQNWDGLIQDGDAQIMRDRLEACPVARRDPGRLGAEAWRVADELGWGRTYDAEYVALARLLGCRLVTADRALWRGTQRLGFVVSPLEL